MSGSFQSPERYGAIFGADICVRVRRMVGVGGTISIRAQNPGHHTLLIPIAAGFSSPGSATVRSSSLAHVTERPRAGRRSSRRVALGRLFGRDRDRSAELLNSCGPLGRWSFPRFKFFQEPSRGHSKSFECPSAVVVHESDDSGRIGSCPNQDGTNPYQYRATENQ